MLWREEAKPVLQQTGVFYLQPPLRSWQECHHPGDRLVIPLLRLLASFSQLLHWFSPLHSLSFIASFTTRNKLVSRSRGTLGHTQRTLSLSMSLLHTLLGASGSLKPANWKGWAQEYLLGHVAMALDGFKATGTLFNMAWTQLALLCQALSLRFKFSASSVYRMRKTDLNLQ